DDRAVGLELQLEELVARHELRQGLARGIFGESLELLRRAAGTRIPIGTDRADVVEIGARLVLRLAHESMSGAMGGAVDRRGRVIGIGHGLGLGHGYATLRGRAGRASAARACRISPMRQSASRNALSARSR